jgi:hypothetical protein
MVVIADSCGLASSGDPDNLYRVFGSSAFYLYIVLMIEITGFARREAGAY